MYLQDKTFFVPFKTDHHAMAKLDPDILRVLPTSRSPVKWMTTPEVAEALRRLNITINHVKTVQRHLQALEEQGVVTSRRAGTALEWQRKEGASGIAARAGNLMTFDEALALQVLKRFAVRQLPSLVYSSLNALFEVAGDKLARGETTEGKRHARWDRKIAVLEGSLKLARPRIRDTVFQPVSQALFTEQLLEIVYRSNKQPPIPPTTHVVMPLGLVEAADLIYLVAKVPGKPAAVMYRLDRMERAKLKDEGFSYPRDFFLSAYVETEKMFDYFPRGEIKLVLKFAPGTSRTIEEAPIAADQSVEKHDDGTTTIRATIMMTERLRWWIRAFGPYVEVLEPADLRADFEKEAEAAYALYRGKTA